MAIQRRGKSVAPDIALFSVTLDASYHRTAVRRQTRIRGLSFFRASVLASKSIDLVTIKTRRYIF